jgi:hypothetical protein
VIATHVERMVSTAGPAVAYVSEVSITVARRLRQAGCGLTGHEMVRRFEPERMSLQCLSCGRETRGWTLHDRPYAPARRPSAAMPHKAARHAMA